METNLDCGMFSAVIPETISFNVPIKNRNRFGGVMTPPYETSPKFLFFGLDRYFKMDTMESLCNTVLYRQREKGRCK